MSNGNENMTDDMTGPPTIHMRPSGPGGHSPERELHETRIQQDSVLDDASRGKSRGAFCALRKGPNTWREGQEGGRWPTGETFALQF